MIPDHANQTVRSGNAPYSHLKTLMQLRTRNIDTVTGTLFFI
jgi:hypothetical protein